MPLATSRFQMNSTTTIASSHSSKDVMWIHQVGSERACINNGSETAMLPAAINAEVREANHQLWLTASVVPPQR